MVFAGTEKQATGVTAPVLGAVIALKSSTYPAAVDAAEGVVCVQSRRLSHAVGRPLGVQALVLVE